MMNWRRVFLLAMVWVWGAACAGAQEPAPPVVLGYYPSWASNLPPDKIDFTRLTHLVHAFVTLHGGGVRVPKNFPSKELTQAAHAAGVKVLLGLGGADSGAQLSAVARDPAKEEACVQELARLVADGGYDGIDVDWEFPREGDAANVVAFVARLREVVRQANPGALVTMPLPWTDSDGKYFDGARLAPLVDFVMLMTYDAHGPWKADGQAYCHAGFNAPLRETGTDKIDGDRYSFAKAVDYWKGKGFAERQLVIGLHAFGHGFLVENWGDTPAQPSKHGDIDYRKIPPLIAAGWEQHWDDAAAVPWLKSPPGLPPELITYDDPRSVELKGAWARQAGLRGIFLWEITADLVDGHNVLVEAGRKGFGLPVPAPQADSK